VFNTHFSSVSAILWRVCLENQLEKRVDKDKEHIYEHRRLASNLEKSYGPTRQTNYTTNKLPFSVS
jgi:hypothetical protein